MEFDRAHFLRVASQHATPSGVCFSYGTAGFRTDASLLDSTAFRTGILAALRARHTQSTTGLMITASHNPVHDNGVKVADPGGDMLDQSWEPFAEALANAPTPETLLQLVGDHLRSGSVHVATTFYGRVLLARDTRPSGERLLGAAKEGIESIPGVTASVVGVLTTPQLHWMVRSVNRGNKAQESDYFSQLSNGYRCLVEMKSGGMDAQAYSLGLNMVIVDGANGVGASKVSKLETFLHGLFKVDVRNSGNEGDGTLNDRVGADFVQKEKMFPCNFGYPDESGQRCASFDGDADRIVFFYGGDSSEDEKGQRLCLLDGDKILALFAVFIRKQLQDLYTGANNTYPIKLGIVQTAYANGASTKFLQESLAVEVAFTATGVKHLHHKAAGYDVGIYFEANGHGTILFKDAFLHWLQKKYGRDNDCVKESDAAQWKAAQMLLAASAVMNQAIGDACSALLLVEAILNHQGWSIQDWDAIYTDLPSRQVKVKVKDRTSIKTTNAEMCVMQPPGLQSAIDLEVGKVEAGRAFVRPSGTEDVVRVYAEAATQQEADALAHAVASHVYRLAEGVGALPSLK